METFRSNFVRISETTVGYLFESAISEHDSDVCFSDVAFVLKGGTVIKIVIKLAADRTFSGCRIKFSKSIILNRIGNGMDEFDQHLDGMRVIVAIDI